jgi:hypothetical protein
VQWQAFWELTACELPSRLPFFARTILQHMFHNSTHMWPGCGVLPREKVAAEKLSVMHEALQNYRSGEAVD